MISLTPLTHNRDDGGTTPINYLAQRSDHMAHYMLYTMMIENRDLIFRSMQKSFFGMNGGQVIGFKTLNHFTWNMFFYTMIKEGVSGELLTCLIATRI